ncbi:AraC family transcriptional regulator [Lachnospiraceae bacterium MD335]|nr:AraC family transcriptional regulator [Lachnospiraceae bacterium MD335]
MSKKKKESAEFRFYELSNDKPALVLIGDKWKQIYGENINNMHFHNLFEIGYCHYGAGDLVIEEEHYRFAKQMVSCIPANFLHVTRSDTEVIAYWEWIYINPAEILKDCGKTPQEIRAVLEAVNDRAFFVHAQENPVLAALVRAVFDEMRHKDEHHLECVRGMVYALVFEIARFNNKEVNRTLIRNGSLQLERAIEYVDANYPNAFRIADLAEVCHMSETHFRRIFQEKMNMKPVEYVNFVRIRKACELIDKTDISMEEVAGKVGFVTPSTFNRNFRRIVGTSPYQWKKRPDSHERKLAEYKISALKGW